MDNFIVIKKNGTLFNLFNHEPFRVVKSATLEKELSQTDVVKVEVLSSQPLNLYIGDCISLNDNIYQINQLPEIEKISTHEYVTNIAFEGVMYELAKAMFFDRDEEFRYNIGAEFSIPSNIVGYMKMVCNNMNSLNKYTWQINKDNIDNVVKEKEVKTIDFSNELCLSALQKICDEFNVYFIIEKVSGCSMHDVFVGGINGGDVKSGKGNAYNSTTYQITLVPKTKEKAIFERLKYGHNEAIHKIERINNEENNVINRLYIRGANKNIQYSYPQEWGEEKNSQRLLPRNEQNEIVEYIEDVEHQRQYGIIESSYFDDDIFPNYIGAVSEVETETKKIREKDEETGEMVEKEVFTYGFIDREIDFDLLEENGNGTTALIDGVTPKIHFNTGGLAGYEFELLNMLKKSEHKYVIMNRSNQFCEKYFVSRDVRQIQFLNHLLTESRVEFGDEYIYSNPGCGLYKKTYTPKLVTQTDDGSTGSTFTLEEGVPTLVDKNFNKGDFCVKTETPTFYINENEIIDDITIGFFAEAIINLDNYELFVNNYAKHHLYIKITLFEENADEEFEEIHNDTLECILKVDKYVDDREVAKVTYYNKIKDGTYYIEHSFELPEINRMRPYKRTLKAEIEFDVSARYYNTFSITSSRSVYRDDVSPASSNIYDDCFFLIDYIFPILPEYYFFDINACLENRASYFDECARQLGGYYAEIFIDSCLPYDITLVFHKFEVGTHGHNNSKAFWLKSFIDEQGQKYPDKDSAFMYDVDDKYVFLDIYPPKKYVREAEKELFNKGKKEFERLSNPLSLFNIELNKHWIRKQQNIYNVLKLGEFVNVEDEHLQSNGIYQIVKFSQDLINKDEVEIEVSNGNRRKLNTRKRLRKLENIARFNSLGSFSRAKRTENK